MMKQTILICLLLSNQALACAVTPELEFLISSAAEAHDIDPILFDSLVRNESAYCADAVSSAGAIGLGQLMPETAKALGVDPHVPQENLAGAAAYLKQQYNAFGTWELALAAYNAGPNAVRYFGGIPPLSKNKETLPYVQKVLKGWDNTTVTVPVPEVRAKIVNTATLIPQTSNMLVYSRPPARFGSSE